MQSGEPLLAAEHLTKQYGNVVALNDVSFSIFDGITGILGENGAGKRTAIKIFLGLIPPTSGSAMVLGQNASESVGVRAPGSGLSRCLRGHERPPERDALSPRSKSSAKARRRGAIRRNGAWASTSASRT